ncbi:MAG: sulfur carrier protein ThiS [Verrucomicrobiota bacterium]
MKITVNGEVRDIESGRTLKDLLESSGYETAVIAVALNADFVSRGDYAETRLSEGDEVEIVSPRQGG